MGIRTTSQLPPVDQHVMFSTEHATSAIVCCHVTVTIKINLLIENQGGLLSLTAVLPSPCPHCPCPQLHNAPSASCLLYISSCQDDSHWAEWPKNNHSQPSLHQTRPVEHRAGTQHSGSTYALFFNVLQGFHSFLHQQSDVLQFSLPKQHWRWALGPHSMMTPRSQ